MKRLLFVLLNLTLPLFSQTSNLILTREVRFNWGGNIDWFFGLIFHNGHLIGNGAMGIVISPPWVTEAAIGKFTLTGEKIWVTTDSGLNGSELSWSGINATAIVNNRIIWVFDDSVFIKLDQGGNVLLKKSINVAVGNPRLFITNWEDTVVAVERRTNGNIVLLDENGNLIRRFPMQANGYGWMTPRVKGDTLWLGSNEAMFGTYVAQYNLRTSQQNWRFDTPDTDTLRSFRSMIEVDQTGNVYCAGNKGNYYTGQLKFFAYSLNPSGNLRWYTEWLPAGDWRLNYGNWARSMALSNSGLLCVGGAVEHQRQPVDPNENDAYLALFQADNGQFLEEDWWKYDEDAQVNANMDALFIDNKLILLGYAANGPQTTWTWGYLRFYDVITSVEQISSEIPEGFVLRQNYPNPFNPATTIEFSLPERSFVKLTILNLLGQEVETLVSKELNAGTHRVIWNVIDVGRQSRQSFPSGVYLYQLETPSFRAVKKMLLPK